MAAKVNVQINHAGMAALFMTPGVKAEVHKKAEEVAVTADALQGDHGLKGDVSVTDTTSDALGYGIENRPVSAVVFTGEAWGTEGHKVAGAPKSGKDAVQHFAKG